MKNKLLEFKMEGGGIRHFEIYGDIKETILDFADNRYLDFADIEMYEIKDKEKVPYEPVGTTWATGQRLTVYDATSDVVDRIVRNQTKDFEVLYVRDDIKEYQIAKRAMDVILGKDRQQQEEAEKEKRQER